jgi:FkbH-like protein
LNLIEALEYKQKRFPEDAPVLRVFLGCGFTPVHLETFLAAHIGAILPQTRVEIKTGLFGDLLGNVERLQPSDFDAIAAVVEWADLDQRLGVRNLGGWQVDRLPDVLETVSRSLARLGQTLQRLSSSLPVSLCLPTLPLPPLFFTPNQESSHYELRLREHMASFAVYLAGFPRLRVVNAQYLDECSPPGARFDFKSEIIYGFPYKTAHASVIAEGLAALIHTSARKKGLITDLDDTLWSGILGEVGAEGISWHIDQKTHIHGIYQQFLASLSSAGVLIAIASKNDGALVKEALEREDLQISKESIFPVEAHWSRKSESISRILKVWNIAADSVVFLDDSPMEVAEVKSAFPEMECLVFPKTDYTGFWEMLKTLRNLFGKAVLSEEDSLRLQSIRNASGFQESLSAQGSSADRFLQEANASLLFTFGKSPTDTRSFELINKTNQFNLNGGRFNESAWVAFLDDPKSFAVAVSYEDKFGKLGKIGVLLGKACGRKLFVESWVMSCRAFSRRIEHQCLKYLFEKFDAEEIRFAYRATSRNGPLQEFLAQILDSVAEEDCRLSRESFYQKAPALFHRVEEVELRG